MQENTLHYVLVCHTGDTAVIDYSLRSLAFDQHCDSLFRKLLLE